MFSKGWVFCRTVFLSPLWNIVLYYESNEENFIISGRFKMGIFLVKPYIECHSLILLYIWTKLDNGTKSDKKSHTMEQKISKGQSHYGIQLLYVIGVGIHFQILPPAPSPPTMKDIQISSLPRHSRDDPGLWLHNLL